MKTPKSGKGSPGYTPEKPKSSKYRGVSYRKATSQWIASLNVGGNCIAQPAASEEEAARLYDRMAIRWLRSRAKTNFPLSEYEMPELPPVVSGLGVVTSEYIRAACRRYILSKGLVSNKRMENWTMVNNLFFWENTSVSQEWIMEWCRKLGIDPMGTDL